jgi:asparagine synthase (glutamine-hydrolysing)
MCGILGIVTTNGSQPAREELAQLAALISHRGPDHTGIYSAHGIGLAHTRLSIIDLNERSNQPFWDDTGRYCIIYNGEIYNFEEIRKRLTARGEVFRTSGDTEVLLKALIHDGEAAIPEFMGMFAFCFYDKQKGDALLCRDRFGIKPLFFSHDSNRLVFSSEQAPILQATSARPDMSTISAYLLGFGGPHRYHSFFDKIKILPPGHLMRITNGKTSDPEAFFRISSFWVPAISAELEALSDDAVVDRLDALLVASVKQHMIADTQVAALCSGGVDSSLILAVAARNNSNLAIFHSDVVGRHSERDAAELLARHLGLDLQVTEVRDHDFIDGIPKVTRHYGQPFAYHPNSIPFLKVTELVREHKIKVILTGEAADESYLGYSYLPTQDWVAKLQNVFARIGQLIRRNPLVGRALFSEDVRNIKPLRGFFNRYEEDAEYDAITRELEAANGGRFDLANLKTFKLLSYHLRSLLHRNDALGMASSIEARFPFLDHDTIRFACNLPYRHKIRFSANAAREVKHPFLMTKWAMRQVADRYLPKELSYRPKRGFPTDAFERMQISNNLFRDSFVSEIFGARGADIDFMAQLPDRDLAMRLMLLEIWGRTFFFKQSEDQLTQLLRRNVTLAR